MQEKYTVKYLFMSFQLTAMLTIKNYWQNMEYKLLTVRSYKLMQKEPAATWSILLDCRRRCNRLGKQVVIHHLTCTAKKEAQLSSTNHVMALRHSLYLTLAGYTEKRVRFFIVILATRVQN